MLRRLWLWQVRESCKSPKAFIILQKGESTVRKQSPRSILGRLQMPSHNMESSEADHRPYKRICFGDTFESGNSSFSSSQLGDHGVYTQTPPLLNLEEAQNIYPAISTCETRQHLTIDYQASKCTGSNQYSTETSRRTISYPSASFSAAASTSPGAKDELSLKESADLVCFGMVRLLFLETAPPNRFCQR